MRLFWNVFGLMVMAAALVRLALRSVVREPQADNASWDVFGGEWDNLK